MSGEITQLTPEARELRNARQREYYRQHPEKRREQQIRFWNKKAAAGGNFEVAEAKTDSSTEKRLQELIDLRRKTEKRADLTKETRAAKLKIIDREIAELRSDSRRR